MSNTLYIRAIIEVLGTHSSQHPITAIIYGNKSRIRLPYNNISASGGFVMVSSYANTDHYWYPLNLNEWDIPELETLLRNLKPDFNLESFGFQQELQE